MSDETCERCEELHVALDAACNVLAEIRNVLDQIETVRISDAIWDLDKACDAAMKAL